MGIFIYIISDTSIITKDIAKKYGSNPTLIYSAISPKAGGIKHIPRLHITIIVPIIDWEISLPKNVGVRYERLGKVVPFPSPIINSPNPLIVAGIGNNKRIMPTPAILLPESTIDFAGTFVEINPDINLLLVIPK